MSIDDICAAIRSGCIIRMGFAHGERVWWLDDPYVEVDDETMSAAAKGPNGGPLLTEAGDCLFGWEGNSQTWLSAYA